MANYRQIHVSIWKDSWFLDLEPDEKLLFIYLFSNESTSLSGIYRLAPKVIQFETGMSKDRINEIMDNFSKANKVHHENDIVWIVNMRKFHATKSEKVQTRITADIGSIPDCELKRKYIEYYKLSIPYPYPIDTQPQLKEEEKEKEDEKEKEPAPVSPDASPLFASLRDAYATASGVMISGNDETIQAINDLVKIKATPEDITAAVDWLRENGSRYEHPKYIFKSVKYAIMQREKHAAETKRKREEKANTPPMIDTIETGMDIWEQMLREEAEAAA